jgi:hypothetical protein
VKVVSEKFPSFFEKFKSICNVYNNTKKAVKYIFVFSYKIEKTHKIYDEKGGKFKYDHITSVEYMFEGKILYEM